MYYVVKIVIRARVFFTAFACGLQTKKKSVGAEPTRTVPRRKPVDGSPCTAIERIVCGIVDDYNNTILIVLIKIKHVVLNTMLFPVPPYAFLFLYIKVIYYLLFFFSSIVLPLFTLARAPARSPEKRRKTNDINLQRFFLFIYLLTIVVQLFCVCVLCFFFRTVIVEQAKPLPYQIIVPRQYILIRKNRNARLGGYILLLGGCGGGGGGGGGLPSQIQKLQCCVNLRLLWYLVRI